MAENKNDKIINTYKQNVADLDKTYKNVDKALKDVDKFISKYSKMTEKELSDKKTMAKMEKEFTDNLWNALKSINASALDKMDKKDVTLDKLVNVLQNFGTSKKDYLGGQKSYRPSDTEAYKSIPKNDLYGMREYYRGSGTEYTSQQAFNSTKMNMESLKNIKKFTKNTYGLEDDLMELKSPNITVARKTEIGKTIKEKTENIFKDLEKSGNLKKYMQSMGKEIKRSTDTVSDAFTNATSAINTLLVAKQTVVKRSQPMIEHLAQQAVPSSLKTQLKKGEISDPNIDAQKWISKFQKLDENPSQGFEIQGGDELVGKIFSQEAFDKMSKKQKEKLVESTGQEFTREIAKKMAERETPEGKRKASNITGSIKTLETNKKKLEKSIMEGGYVEPKPPQPFTRNRQERRNIFNQRSRYSTDFQRKFGTGEQKMNVEDMMGVIGGQQGVIGGLEKHKISQGVSKQMEGNLKTQIDRYNKIKSQLQEIEKLKNDHLKLEDDLSKLLKENADDTKVKNKLKQIKDKTQEIHTLEKKNIQDSEKLYKGIEKTEKDILKAKKSIQTQNAKEYELVKKQRDLTHHIKSLKEDLGDLNREEQGILEKMVNIQKDGGNFTKDEIDGMRKLTNKMKERLNVAKDVYDERANTLGIDKEEINYKKKVKNTMMELNKLEEIMNDKQASRNDKIKASKAWIKGIQNLEEENLKIQEKQKKLDIKHEKSLKNQLKSTRSISADMKEMFAQMRGSSNSLLTNLIHIKGALIGFGYFLKSNIIKGLDRSYDVIKNIVNLTDEITLSRSALASIFSPTTKPNFSFADEILRLSEQIAVNAQDTNKSYQGLPITFKDVVTTMKAMSSIPNIKATFFRDMEKDGSFNLKDKIKAMASASIKLTTIDPTQTTEGALFSLREALSGDFISLKKRFEIQPEFIAQSINKSVDYLKQHPMEFLRGLDVFFEENFGDTMRAKMEDTVQGIVIQVESAFQVLGRRLGEGDKGINKQLINNFFIPLKKNLTDFLKGDFGDYFVNGVQERFGKLIEEVKTMTVELVSIVGEAFGVKFLENVENPVERASLVFLKLMDNVVMTTRYVNELFKTKRSDFTETLKTAMETIRSMTKMMFSFGEYFLNQLYPQFLSFFQFMTSNDSMKLLSSLMLIVGPGNLIGMGATGLSMAGSIASTGLTLMQGEKIISSLNGTSTAVVAQTGIMASIKGLFSGFVTKITTILPTIITFLSNPVGWATVVAGILGTVVFNKYMNKPKLEIEKSRRTGDNFFAKLMEQKKPTDFETTFGLTPYRQTTSGRILPSKNVDAFNKSRLGYGLLGLTQVETINGDMKAVSKASLEGVDYFRRINTKIMNQVYEIIESKKTIDQLRKTDIGKLLDESGYNRQLDKMFSNIKPKDEKHKKRIQRSKEEIIFVQTNSIQKSINNLLEKMVEQEKVDLKSAKASERKTKFERSSGQMYISSIMESLDRFNQMLNDKIPDVKTSEISNDIKNTSQSFEQFFAVDKIKDIKKLLDENKKVPIESFNYFKNFLAWLTGVDLAKLSSLEKVDLTKKSNLEKNIENLEKFGKAIEVLKNPKLITDENKLKTIEKINKELGKDIFQYLENNITNFDNNIQKAIKKGKQQLSSLNTESYKTLGDKLTKIYSGLFNLDESIMKENFKGKDRQFDENEVKGILSKLGGTIDIKEITLTKLKDYYEIIQSLLENSELVEKDKIETLGGKLRQATQDKVIQINKEFIDFQKKYNTQSLKSLQKQHEEVKNQIETYSQAENKEMVGKLTQQSKDLTQMIVKKTTENIKKMMKVIENSITRFDSASSLFQSKGLSRNDRLQQMIGGLTDQSFKGATTGDIISKRRSQIEEFKKLTSSDMINQRVKEVGKEQYIKEVKSLFETMNSTDIQSTIENLAQVGTPEAKEQIVHLKALKMEIDAVRNSSSSLINDIMNREYQFTGMDSFFSAFSEGWKKMENEYLTFDEMLQQNSANTARIMNDNLKNGFFQLFKGKTEEAKDAFDNMMKSIRDEFFQTTAEMAKRAVKDGLFRLLGNIFGGGLFGGGTTVSNPVTSFTSNILPTSAFSSSSSTFGGTFTDFMKRANGGIINSPELALIGERSSTNPEFVMNSPQVQRLITTSINQAQVQNNQMRSNGGSKEIVQNLNFTYNVSGQGDDTVQQIRQLHLQIPSIVKNELQVSLNEDSSVQNSVKRIAQS